MDKFKRCSFSQSDAVEYIEKVRLIEKSEHNKFFIETYGCQMNVHDSEKLSGMLREMGYEPAEDKKQADVIIFNTCCVRENAELRVYGNVGALRMLKQEKPWLKIGICGCMMQQADVVAAVKRRFPFVDMVFGSHNTHELPILLYGALTDGLAQYKVLESPDAIIEGTPISRDNGFSAWITVMYGCNNFCSYCIVPYVRGRERSRKSVDIINEARELAKQGYKEITLLGQNVNSYGKDCGEISFAELLKELNKIDGISRIGFMTSHPKDCSDELIQAIAECKKVSRQLHLPVQSGSDRILKEMNRRYTQEDYLRLIDRVKKAIPDVALTTDIIVGFPGETEEDFEQTLKLYKAVGFASSFTFIYSKRNGTPAAKMDEQVPVDVKKERLARLIELQAECTAQFQSRYKDNVYEVLVESVSKRSKNMVSGRTQCGRMVSFSGNEDLIGKTVKVKIMQIKANTLSGIALLDQ